MDQIKLPRPDLPFTEQDNDTLLACCIWGEARGERISAKEGVANVILARAAHPRWWGRDLKGVILKPMQFSSFNANDPNRNKLLNPLKHDSPEVWDECYSIAWNALVGAMADNTGGADSYFDDSIKPPKWAKAEKFTVKIGRLNFYRIEI